MARLGALNVAPPRTCVSAGRAEAQRCSNRESDCFSVGQILVKCLAARRRGEDLVVVARGGWFFALAEALLAARARCAVRFPQLTGLGIAAPCR